MWANTHRQNERENKIGKEQQKRRRVPTCSVLRKSAHVSHSSSCIILSFQGTTAATNVFSHMLDCEFRGADHSSCHNETAIKSVKYNHRGERKVVEVIQNSVYVPTVVLWRVTFAELLPPSVVMRTQSVTKEMACVAEWGFRHAAAMAGFTRFTLPSAWLLLMSRHYPPRRVPFDQLTV